MDSTDSKPGKPKKKKKSGGSSGLSASDLRARLGLKSGGRKATSSTTGSGENIRARLGLDASSDQSSDLAGPATSRIEKSVLDSLKKGLPPKMAPSGGEEEPQQSPQKSNPQPQKSSESTQALSIDEFEDMLVEEEPSSAKDELVDALDDVDVDDLFGQAPGATDAPAAEPAPEPTLQPEPEPQVQEAAQPVAAASGEASLSTQPEPEVQDLDLEPEVDASLLVEETPDVDDLEGEKTSLLDTSSMFEDDEEFDAFPSEDKTQIMMSAMDYDPLIGRLMVESGEAPQSEFVLARDETVMGRGTKSDLVIPDIAMSRKHCTFERYQEGFVVRDLDSGNGTYVNQRRINYAELRDGDIIEVGNVKFRFEQSGGEPDKLWKGEAKIELHPKDGGGPSRSAPAAPSGAVSNQAHPQQHQVPQQQMPQQQMPQQQMPNYQQGPWGTGMMPAQGPYGQQQQGGYPGYPYGGGTQHGMPQVNQRRGSPVVTAAIVFFSILLIGLVLLIVWSLVDQKSGGGEEAAAQQEESPQQKKERAAKLVNQGSQLFDQRRWDAAREKFEAALELDPEDPTAKLFVSEVIPREKMTEEQIIKAMSDIRESPTAANYEKALQVLSTVDAESTFASEVKGQHLPDVKNAYRKLLVRNAQKAIDAKNWPKAKRDLMKVTDDLGMADDPEVKSLLKQIEIRQKKEK